MPAVGITDPEVYVQRLREPGGEQELRALLPLVTVGHTEFFRDPKQFRALERCILPQLLAKARRELRKVYIWSAGCATGEEPYSMAMVMAELGALPRRGGHLGHGPEPGRRGGREAGALLRAARGQHVLRAARALLPAHGGGARGRAARSSEYIRFDGQNLAAPSFTDMVAPQLAGPHPLPQRHHLLRPAHHPRADGSVPRRRCGPGGLLFLGYSESLFKVYDRFEMIEVDGAFVYRRPLVEQKSGRMPLQPLSLTPAPVATPAPIPSTGLPSRPRVPETPAMPSCSKTPAGGTDTLSSLKPAAVTPDPLTAIRERLAANAKLSPSHGSAQTPDPVRPTRLTLEMPAVGSPEPRVLRATEVPGGAKKLPPAERLDQAVRKMLQSDFTAAINDVEELLVDEPGHLDGLLTLGNLYSLTGRIADAREAFAQALDREPLCVEARVFGGVAALQAGAAGRGALRVQQGALPGAHAGHRPLPAGAGAGAHPGLRGRAAQLPQRHRPAALPPAAARGPLPGHAGLTGGHLPGGALRARRAGGESGHWLSIVLLRSARLLLGSSTAPNFFCR